MVTTQKQLADRKNYIGSSDAAAILGFDTFRTAYDVWLEKTEKLEPVGSEAKHLIRGNFIERATLDWFEKRTGLKIRRGSKRSARDRGLPMACHLDAQTVEAGYPVEAKSVGAYSNEVWGEDSTDQIPDRVLIQNHHEMICTDTNLCYVPVYLPYRDFCLFEVRWNQIVGETIKERCIDFWENNVLKDIPPEEVGPSLAIAKRIRRQPNKSIQISDTIINHFEEAKEVFNKAKKQKEKFEAKLIAALGDAEEGVTETGKIVTYMKYERKGYQVNPTSYRSLKFPKPKK